MTSLQTGVSLQAGVYGGETQASHWVEETELEVYKVARISRAKNLRRENYTK